jgi:hypothetical protein
MECVACQVKRKVARHLEIMPVILSEVKDLAPGRRDPSLRSELALREAKG